MKKVSVLLVLFFFQYPGYAQGGNDTLQARIILIGDGGQFNAKGQHPVVAAVRKNMNLDAKTTIVYLGDNLYKAGLPDELNLTYKAIRAVLDTQINVAKGSKAKVYFIPGNHDWDEFGAGGWDAVVRQQHYVDALGDANVNFYPKDGCPGPVKVDINDQVVLIMLDSQWWLHRYDKPGIESDCDYKTNLEVLNELDNLLDQNSKKLVIVATHHPLKSNGIHGGYFGWKQALFPLTDFKKNLYIPFPGIGLIYPIVRGVFGTPQDLKHPTYANMITEIEKVVRPHKNVIFVAGHEHTQQLIKDSGYYYIVSGSGAKESRVSLGHNGLFATDTTGFATLEISNRKNVRATFYDVHDTSMHAAYSKELFNFSTIEQDDTTRIVNIPDNADSITISANPRYNEASALKRFFNGENYRKEWATPVKMKIFYLKKLGYTIESLGGGRQTKTLTLVDKNQKRWVLRTIDKDLEKLLPDDFTGASAQTYLSDFISTAHPYAPLIVPTLARASGLVVARPTLFFVPDDQALGLYRKLFANKVVMLEEREPTPDKADTKSTAKLINKMIEDNDHHVDEALVLKARLLDVLLADWDRHFDQWRFGEGDTGKGKLYYPIPRDRDEALSNSNGLIVKFLGLSNMPYLRGFKKNIMGFKWQAYEARDFDRLFLNNLNEKEWTKLISNFQNSITDKVIHEAVMKLPPEIYPIRGLEIERVLRSRRDEMMSSAMQYYKFLAREVNVVGSNLMEYFKVSKAGDDIQVRVYKRKDDLDSASVIFNRIFSDKQTKEIRFYGLSKDDLFEVDEDATSKIKLRIIGGRGVDTFKIKGTINSVLYDFNRDSNAIVKSKNTQVEISNEPGINEYSPTGYQYNRFYFPTVNAGYNIEDGVLTSAMFGHRTYAFRKNPYASDQRLATTYAFGARAFKLNYDADFNKVFNNAGLLVKANLVTPVVNNFFGLGNNTKFNPTLKQSYYRVRYNYAELETLLSTRVSRDQIVLGIGPHIYRYWTEPKNNAGKVLNRPELVGLDSANIYKSKFLAGVKTVANINTLNDDLFPTRGLLWKTQFSALASVKNSKPFTSFTTDITLYSSLSDPAPFLTVARLGYGHIFSKNYEYFQALNLGQNNFLRGYRKNRFAGRSIAYGSFEARVKILNTKSYFLPGTFGFIAFNDVGKVWVRSVTSKTWHYSFGGGLYYMAYNKLLLSAMLAHSKEETLVNFTIGTKFNLNF